MEFKATIDGILRQWYADVGDIVEADEPLVEIETAAVDVELVAPITGRVTEMQVLPGDSVTKGMVLARIEPVPQSIGTLIDEQARKPGRKKQSTIIQQSYSRRQLALFILAGMMLAGIVTAGIILVTVRSDPPMMVVTAQSIVVTATPFPTATRFSSRTPAPTIYRTPTAMFDSLIWNWSVPVALVQSVDNLPAGTRVLLQSTWYDQATNTRYYDVVSASDPNQTATVPETFLEAVGVPSVVPTLNFRTGIWAWFYPLLLTESVANVPAGTLVQIVDAAFDGAVWRMQVVTAQGLELNVVESQLDFPATRPVNPSFTPVAHYAHFNDEAGFPLLTTEQVDHIPAFTPVNILGMESGFGEWTYRIVMENDPRVATARESQLQVSQ